MPECYKILRDRAPDMFTIKEAVDLWLEHRPEWAESCGEAHIRRTMRRMRDAGLLQSPVIGLYFVALATEVQQAMLEKEERLRGQA